MKQYFEPTAGKILGVIILLALSSMNGVLPFVANPTSFLAGNTRLNFGFPYPIFSITGEVIGNLNIPYLLIDIVIFYLVLVALSFVFKGRKEENVPNSNSRGRDIGPSTEA